MDRDSRALPKKRREDAFVQGALVACTISAVIWAMIWLLIF